jgi:predicted pyridoxine 5'-phosphate oxidase superfamily flavin-nucleotide-binding protein
MQSRQKDDTVWHEGELEVQRCAGVLEDARKMQGGIFSSMPAPVMKFLSEQQFSAFSSRDRQQRVWATLRFGPRGFINAVDPFRVQMAAVGTPDLLAQNIEANPDIGMVAIDLAHRRRIRLNGEAFNNADGSITLHARQVYSNCPRYIQEREIPELQKIAAPQSGPRGTELNAAQAAWIERADTLFIATAHPVYGADASHRGGMPGFVRVESSRRLAIPDYDGNRMFNTLGNIAADPHTGLLFPDFVTGNALMLTGRARVIWDASRAAQFTGAQRVVEYEIDETLELQGALPGNWEFKSYSPYNPER